MRALIEEAPELFRVDLATVGARGGWLRQFANRRAQADPYALGRAVRAVMDRCTVRAVSGNRLLWNEYRIFLSQSDHDRLRPLAARMQRELAPALREEVRQLGCEMEGPLVIRLLVDEEQDLPVGTARIRVAFKPGAAAAAQDDDEITVRVGVAEAAPVADASTERLAEPVDAAVLQLRWSGGSAAVPMGRRVVVGRPHEGAQGFFVALAGAGHRVSRRHAWVEAAEQGATIGRLPDANPVQVNGRLIQPGGSLTVDALPVEISLSSGELTVFVDLPGSS